MREEPRGRGRGRAEGALGHALRFVALCCVCEFSLLPKDYRRQSHGLTRTHRVYTVTKVEGTKDELLGMTMNDMR